MSIASVDIQIDRTVDLAMSNERSGVCVVSISELSAGESPRLGGENQEHVWALSQVEDPLPPLLVHRPTMRVIDGMHRLCAAQLRGQDQIEVRFFDGDAADAFLLAVRANVAHGLPLSLEDRKAAAVRIVRSHPEWSDRAIAVQTGLAHKTVGKIRKRSGGENPHPNVRIGRDGTARPLTNSQGRQAARDLIDQRPDTPLREIAKVAGISLSTAHDVRRHLAQEGSAASEAMGHVMPARQGNDEPTAAARSVAPEREVDRQRMRQDLGRRSVLGRLGSDPSLRFTEQGRLLLRMLHLHAVVNGEWRRLAEELPHHCIPDIVTLAREYAVSWQKFADYLVRVQPGDKLLPQSRDAARVNDHEVVH